MRTWVPSGGWSEDDAEAWTDDADRPDRSLDETVYALSADSAFARYLSRAGEA